MIKIQIHIDTDFPEQEAYINVMLPSVPRQGDFLFLSNEEAGELENKVKDPDKYYMYQYGKNKELSFEDCIVVDHVIFISDGTIKLFLRD